MSPTIRRTASLLLLLCILLGFQGTCEVWGDEGRKGEGAALPADIEQVLWWLPEDTESIVVSRGQPPIPEFLQPEAPPPNPSGKATVEPVAGFGYRSIKYDFEHLVAQHCIEPLVYFQGLYSGDERYRLINQHFGPRSATLFVKAVWWNNNTTRETCDIVLFQNNMAELLLASIAAFPHERQLIDNVPVLKVDLNNGVVRKQKLNWLAAIRPNVFVCTTDRLLLKTIIERMARRGINRALPPELPEWDLLDPAAPAWGLRHYRAAIADSDNSSMRKWDPDAQGMVLFGEGKPTHNVVLRYLSRSEDGLERFQRMQKSSLAPFLMERDSILQLAPVERVSADCLECRTRINVLPDQDDRPGLSVEGTFWFGMNGIFLPWLGFPVHPEEAVPQPSSSPFQ